MSWLSSSFNGRKSETIVFQSENEELVTPNIFWLHSWSLNETRDALSQSLFNNIPNEIILHLFRFFSVSDLCNISLVCRFFKNIADQNQFWKTKCDTSKELYFKPYKHIYMKSIHQTNKHKNELREKKWSMYMNDSLYKAVCIRCPFGQSPPISLSLTNKYQLGSIRGFYQHPNSSQEMTIKLSVDIDKMALELISLLEKASRFQKRWQQSVVFKQMIQRYYRFMKLKSSNPPNILLIPTLDIEIIWQTHLLRPEIYKNDCLRLFGQVVDHSLILNNITETFKREAFFDTYQLYQKRFGDKYCSLPVNWKIASNYFHRQRKSLNYNQWIYSYWDKTYFEFSSNEPIDYENPFSFTEDDFILDGKWLNLCKQFMRDTNKKLSIWTGYFNRSMKIDLRSGALKRLKKSYEKFLYMAVKYSFKYKNGFILPTYAIDIIWHSHMQEPSKYADDCQRLFGHMIYHDPWPIIVDQNMKKWCDQIWKDEFKCEIEIDHLHITSDNN